MNNQIFLMIAIFIFTLCTFQVRLTLDLHHCVHEFLWRGTDYDRCRQLFLYDTEICVLLEQDFGDGKQSRSSSTSRTCGPSGDILAGGVPLHGLSPGTYTLHICMSFSEEHRLSSDDDAAEIAQASCFNSSSSLWQLADLRRSFAIEDTISPKSVMLDFADEDLQGFDADTSSHQASLKARTVDDGVRVNGSNKLPPRPMSSSAVCGSYEDDSEWCIYRPACLDTATLGLVFLDFAPDSSDTLSQLGRKDDLLFVPTSLDRSSWEGPKALNNDLPHRSAAFARHLSASSFADAKKRGAVAWFDPISDPQSGGINSNSYVLNDRNQKGSDSSGRSGRVGLMFIDAPQNVYHAATKALQLSYAAKEPSGRRQMDRGSFLDAVVPLLCTENGCQPAHASHNNAPAAAWLDGLLALLFSNATTQVIHDPSAWASAIHEKTKPYGADSKSPVELLCFREVVVPGESRALFRGPADARRFRFNARRYLGLSPVVLHPPPKVGVNLYLYSKQRWHTK